MYYELFYAVNSTKACASTNVPCAITEFVTEDARSHMEPPEESNCEDERPSTVTANIWIWARNPYEEPYVDKGVGGKWFLLLDKREIRADGMCDLDLGWVQVKRLVETGVIYASKCCTGLEEGPYIGEIKGVIACYTPDYRDKEDVRRVADAVASVVNLDYPMYYKTDKASREGLYRHLGDSQISIYKYSKGEMFQREGSLWLPLAEVKEKGEDFVYPSTVTEVPLIWSRYCRKFSHHRGKWLLTFDQKVLDEGRKTELDVAWGEVKKLAEGLVIYYASCTTASFRKWKDVSSATGSISFHTSDYTDIDELKSTADAIRSVLYFERPMYYLVDKVSVKKCSWREDRYTGHFMHTVDGQLWEKDDVDQWKLVTSEEEEEDVFSHPSRVQSTKVLLANSKSFLKGDNIGKWVLFLDSSEKDDEGCTELDRTWIRVKEIVGANKSVISAACPVVIESPNDLQENVGMIFCYTACGRNAVKAAEDIRTEIQTSRQMFFVPLRAVPVKDLLTMDYVGVATYKYSEEGKLFEKIDGDWVTANVEHHRFEPESRGKYGGAQIRFTRDIPEGKRRIGSNESSTGTWIAILDKLYRYDEILDLALSKLQVLVEKGVLFDAVSMTERGTCQDSDCVIFCYVKHSKNRKDVKRTAEAIRREVDMFCDMWYIPKKHTRMEDLETVEAMSLYRLTASGKLYEQVFGDWIPANVGW